MVTGSFLFGVLLLPVPLFSVTTVSVLFFTVRLITRCVLSFEKADKKAQAEYAEEIKQATGVRYVWLWATNALVLAPLRANRTQLREMMWWIKKIDFDFNLRTEYRRKLARERLGRTNTVLRVSDDRWSGSVCPGRGGPAFGCQAARSDRTTQPPTPLNRSS